MGERVIQCAGCGVKLKIKDDRPIPRDAACPKCNVPLASKSSSSPPAQPQRPASWAVQAAPNPPVKMISRRRSAEEFDDIDDDFEEVSPRSRSRRSSSQTISVPAWLLGAGIGTLFVGLIVVVFLLLPRGEKSVTAPPASPAANTIAAVVTNPPPPASSPASSPLATPTLPPSAPQNASSGIAVIPTSPSTSQEVVARYHPAPNSEYHYKYEINSDLGDYVEKATGNCDLTAQARPTEESFSVQREKQQGSGSGFVVGPNGLIITCAHVVDDAEKIEVVIAGQTYPASLIASDANLDVAAIQINATGLPTLPIANSDQIQLGQPLTVIGFPLSNVLGTGIKVTQGAVSGIVDHQGQRQIQTDAAINPGNSGGPVFNSRGEVIGIASAKLSGTAVSQVGFCVPSSSLSAWMQRNGLVAAAPSGGAEIDTPTMVQKVSPAVAFIKVETGPDIRSQLAFQFSAHQTSRPESRNGTPVLRRLPRISHDNGTLLISDLGQPTLVPDGDYAPIVMTRLPLLPFVDLSHSRKGEWTNQRDISIAREDRSNEPLGPSRRIFRPRFGQKPNIVSVQSAVEIDKYNVISNDAQTLVLGRNYELKTTDNGEPGIHLTGTGSWSFDHADGMPLKTDLKGTFKITLKGQTVTVPYTLTLSRLTPEELEKRNAAIAAAQKRQEAAGTAVAAEEDSDAAFTINAKSWGYKTLAISPNSKFCAVTDSQDAIYIYDLATGQEIDSKIALKDFGEPSESIYTPDGKHLLLGGRKGIIRCWKIDDKGEIDLIGDFVGHSGEIHAIKVLPDNRTVISSDQKKQVKVWDLEDRSEKYPLPAIDDEIVAIGTSPDGKSGMLVSTSSKVTLFKLADGKVTASDSIFKSHFGKVAAFSPDGKTLFIPDAYKLTGHEFKSKHAPEEYDLGESIWDVVYCPETNEVLAAGNAQIHVIDRKKKTRTDILKTGASASGYVKCLDISPDGRFVVAIAGPIGQTLAFFDRHASKSKQPQGEVKSEDSKSRPPSPRKSTR